MSGSIPMVECLREAGLVLTQEVYVGAAKAGSMAMVQWLAREAGVSDAMMPMRDALPLIRHWPEWPAWATCNNRSLLQAVQLVFGEADCRGRGAAARPDIAEANMGLSAVSFAVRWSDMALVQYLTEQRSAPKPCWAMARELLFRFAAKAGCEALVEWLAQQPGCLEGPAVGCPYTDAAENSDRGTLVALRRLGVPWGPEDSLVGAVERGCGMQEQGVPVGSMKKMENVVGGMDAAAVEWLWGLARAAAGAAAAAPGEAWPGQ